MLYSLNLTVKDHAREYRLYMDRVISAIIIIGLSLTLLLVRLIYLQIIEHDKFATLSNNNQIRVIPINPPRGLIFDRNGVLLAENTPIYSLEIIPSNVIDINKTLSNLQRMFKFSEQEMQNFTKLFKAKHRLDTIPIKLRLTEEELAKFSVEKHLFDDVEVVARLSRNYLFDHAFAHLIGFTGQISEQDLKSNIDVNKYKGIHQIGKTGIEKTAEDILRGSSGVKKVETDAKGNVVREIETILPTAGANLYLTVDAELQMMASELLNNKQGAVVIIEPASGDILTLFSNPSFSANLFAKGMDQQTYQNLQNSQEQPLFNRAISGQYAPGSTVKPFIALQALEHNLITPDYTIYDPGYYKLKNDERLYRGWRREGHGYINLQNAIAQSCGTYFYHVADKLGIDKIHDILSDFGFGKPVGINIDGESIGLAPSRSWKYKTRQQPWFPGETLITGLGQGYTLVTPLQLARAASIIANKGKKVPISTIKKYMLHDKEFNFNQSAYYIAPQVDLQEIKLNNLKNWDIVIQAMQQVINNEMGTAHFIYRPNNVAIAGKTGTAQVFGLKQDEKYDERKIKKQLRDHTWFMAFAPVEDPKIAIAVLLEHEKYSFKVAGKLIDFYLKKIGKLNSNDVINNTKVNISHGQN